MGNSMIFVFGSNELGRHGGGAARAAREKYGAIYERYSDGRPGCGQGFGPQGNSFAIPTCSRPTGEPNSEIEIEKIKYYVDCFLLYARRHPELTFQVTQIGCGLAGWTAEEIAPMFKFAPVNCQFDTAWEPFLSNKTDKDEIRFYWGHVA